MKISFQNLGGAEFGAQQLEINDVAFIVGLLP